MGVLDVSNLFLVIIFFGFIGDGGVFFVNLGNRLCFGILTALTVSRYFVLINLNVSVIKSCQSSKMCRKGG